ncbi:MAG TPA: biotin--[acetyl-CoA-carboxylase] ligase [Rhizomicrobium sp.]|nr:biotin--[acetyl-CoA-carboxylase] ligase [Rhizomicrobium sp.]
MSLWPQGYSKQVYTELDSTNEQARRLAHAGEMGPVWIMAERQTGGRGRRGRAWQSGPGNLAATLLLRPDAPQAMTGQLSFAAALAVADMAAHFAPQAAIAVKWPNDVLAEGKKLAGILLETGERWLAIGIGVNLACHPEDTEFPATSLADLGVPAPSPQEALTILAARFAHWYDAWMKDGFTPLRDEWLARAKGVGEPIRARLPHETREGVFEGIDASGALLLNEGGSLRAIAAGEVFF